MSDKVKVHFDPAFFENFDGTEEELATVMEEITSMFANMTTEDLKEVGQPVDWDNMDPEEAEQFQKLLDNPKRYLQ